jgi:tetrahydromethanopterin S-methyltransferase subunit A
MIKQSTCSNDSMEANFAEGCGCGMTGVIVGGGLTVLFGLGINDGDDIIGGGSCSEVVDGSVDDCVKRCSKRFEHNCRRDFFDSFESS